jgi:hypothetical protein
MDANALQEALRARPFRPFRLNLVDGREVEVKHPEFLALSRNGCQAFSLNEDDSWVIMEPDLISSLDFAAPTTPKNGQSPPSE